MPTESRGPPTKRLRLESSPLPSRSPSIVEVSPPHAPSKSDVVPVDEKLDIEGEHCSICLQRIADRTVVPTCSHEFCFECLLIWTEQSRRCPLCSQTIGDYLIHNIRSKNDYQKHYLNPLRTSPRPQSAAVAAQRDARQRAQTRREREWGRRQRREQEESDELERAIERRRWVYRHGLYAKHVASNSYTRYRPFPTPAQVAASPDLITRATVFLRRELRVWVGLDVEFLTTFTLSLMKSLDIRSEPAVRLLAEFLDMDSGGTRANAEHFAHELYAYLRSPYRDLSVYDTVVQYDIPEDLPPPVIPERSRRWRPRSRSAARSRSRSGSRSRPQLVSNTNPDSFYHENDHLSPRSPASHSTSNSPSRIPPSSRSRHASPRSHATADTASQQGNEESTSRRHQLRKRSIGKSRERDGQNWRLQNHGHSYSIPHDVRHNMRLEHDAQDTSQDRLDPKLQVRADQDALERSRRETQSTSDNPTSEQRKVDEISTNAYIKEPYSLSSNSSSAAAGSRRTLDTRPSAELLTHDPNASCQSPHRDSVDDQITQQSTYLSGYERKGTPKRVRNRNLVESVRSHLSVQRASGTQQVRRERHGQDDRGTPSSTLALGDEEAFRNEGLHAGHSLNPNVPSLLLRLSDPLSASDKHSGPPSGANSQTRVLGTRTPDRKEFPVVQDGTPHGSIAPTSGYSRDSAAQDDLCSLSVSQPSASNLEAPGQGIYGQESGSVLQIRDNSNTNYSVASTDLRTVLLKKLAEEKHMNIVAVGVHDDDSQPVSSSTYPVRGLSVSIDPMSGSNVDEVISSVTEVETVAQREARLRSQAQLRIRLAAAGKTNTANHTLRSGQSEVMDASALNKEEILRGKLLQRRSALGSE